jgi:hypothetical protein
MGVPEGQAGRYIGYDSGYHADDPWYAHHPEPPPVDAISDKTGWLVLPHSGDDLPLPCRSADEVIIKNVFGAGVANDRLVAILREAGRVLVPSGRLMIFETYSPFHLATLCEMARSVGLKACEIVRPSDDAFYELLHAYHARLLVAFSDSVLAQYGSMLQADYIACFRPQT